MLDKSIEIKGLANKSGFIIPPLPRLPLMDNLAFLSWCDFRWLVMLIPTHASGGSDLGGAVKGFKDNVSSDSDSKVEADETKGESEKKDSAD